MSISHIFNGKVISLPGAYSAVKAGSTNYYSTSSYSKVLIINTDKENSFGGAVNGELTKGKDALYRVRTQAEAKSLLKAGRLYQMVKPLFQPSRKSGTNGISDLYYINALTTKAAVMKPELTTGDAELSIQCLDEGPSGNGNETSKGSGVLATGYALKIISGVRDTSKYIIQIWQGTFKGLAEDGYPYDEVAIEDSVPELVSESEEVESVGEFVKWAQGNPTFNNGFRIKSWKDGQFQEADKSHNTLVLAHDGTATYAETDLEAALEYLQDLDFNVLFSLNMTGEDGADTINARFQYFIQNEVRGEKFLAIAGKNDLVTGGFTENQEEAASCNSDRVWLIHGIPRKNSTFVPAGYRTLTPLYLTALLVGRQVGLPPQDSLTFKDIDIDGLEFPLKYNQKEDALSAGLLTVAYDEDLEIFSCIRGVNTLQNNDYIQNADGTSPLIQLTRIAAQLNTDICINAKRRFFTTEAGPNRSSISTQYLEDWVRGQLEDKVATENRDNIIISYSDVSVMREGDAYYVTYKFEPNNEIGFLFFTGFSII